MSQLTRDALLVQADEACIALLKQVDLMLEVITDYVAVPSSGSRADLIRDKDLHSAITTLATLPQILSSIVTTWKKNEHRIWSIFGTETEVLNELYITLECLVMFFARISVNLGDFKLPLARRAHADLVRCNRIL